MPDTTFATSACRPCPTASLPAARAIPARFSEDGTWPGSSRSSPTSRARGFGDAPQEGRKRAEPAAGERLLSALDNDEFTLYWQAIVPLGAGAAAAPFHEVLLRMKEEEESHLPPGTFLPWAEEFGLLHEIDRWVVRHVVDFAADSRRRKDGAYMVNLSAPTLLDPDFVQIVRGASRRAGSPATPCASSSPRSRCCPIRRLTARFVASLEGTGCRFAVSGFGHNPLSLRLLSSWARLPQARRGIVLGMAHDPAELARVKAIANAAHAAGMRIVAECVENESTRAALQGIGIDFAQGFGIAMPIPMSIPDHGEARSAAPLAPLGAAA